MRRFAFNQDLKGMPIEKYDVVIAGGGLAGLYTALNLDKSLSCAVLVKKELMLCNSSLAQGGIAAAVNEQDLFHLRDTIKASAGLANPSLTGFMVEQGPKHIVRLAKMGVPFDTNEQGNWLTTREGAHTRERVLHCGGDATGRLIMQRLTQLALERPNIHILEHHFLTDILTGDDNQVCGAVVYHDQAYKFLETPSLMVAAGGIGSIYKHTTNREGTTGDGIAAAIRAGAQMQHMEFVQFHPTAFFNPRTNQSFFLISEAVRGEGGILRNSEGVAFMQTRHPMKDLAPRDITAREIFLQMQKHNKKHVFLDITSRSKSFLEKRFPTIYNACKDQGIRMEEDPIPVVPVQHYFMGGIKTNSRGQTNIKGLFASGEAACTNVHGANRLASNSLLECLVFGAQCAEAIYNSPHTQVALPPATINQGKKTDTNFGFLADEIREIMQTQGGIVRNKKGLKTALKRLDQIMEKLEPLHINTPAQTEVANMALVARHIIAAALERKNNIGAHYRSDA